MTRLLLLPLVAAASLSGGCAALTNPVADAVPVRRLPAEVLGRPKADLRPIPPTALQQPPMEPYLLDRGDVLAVVADDIIAPETVQAPVKLPDMVSNTAALGFPIPVGEDGTISIPRLPPIPVKGLSVAEVEQLVKDYATGKRGNQRLVVEGRRITVQLLQKRQYRVTVVREDGQQPTLGGTQGFGATRRGNGFTINLQGGENDVLRALNATGGPPGLDARNEVVVLRNLKGKTFEPAALADGAARRQLVMNGDVAAIRIPLRLYPEQQLTIRAEDIILKDGDIVLIEARDTDIYYTAGLIGAGQFALPRDYDLDVIQAIAQVRGPLLNGGFTQNAFVGNSTNTGIGAPSPSLCVVLRKVSPTKQVPIRVDLNRAFVDPRERILIQPGDVIVLQERTNEAITRYLTQTFRINSALDVIAAGGLSAGITGNQ